jgi:hypothetical protein
VWTSAVSISTGGRGFRLLGHADYDLAHPGRTVGDAANYLLEEQMAGGV